MEISSRKLVALCSAVFGGIVLLNFLGQARSNAEFQQRLNNIADLDNLRAKLRRDEGLPDLSNHILPTNDAEFIPEPSTEG